MVWFVAAGLLLFPFVLSGPFPAVLCSLESSNSFV